MTDWWILLIVLLVFGIGIYLLALLIDRLGTIPGSTGMMFGPDIDWEELLRLQREQQQQEEDATE